MLHSRLLTQRTSTCERQCQMLGPLRHNCCVLIWSNAFTGHGEGYKMLQIRKATMALSRQVGSSFVLNELAQTIRPARKLLCAQVYSKTIRWRLGRNYYYYIARMYSLARGAALWSKATFIFAISASTLNLCDEMNIVSKVLFDADLQESKWRRRYRFKASVAWGHVGTAMRNGRCAIPGTTSSLAPCLEIR